MGSDNGNECVEGYLQLTGTSDMICRNVCSGRGGEARCRRRYPGFLWPARYEESAEYIETAMYTLKRMCDCVRVAGSIRWSDWRESPSMGLERLRVNVPFSDLELCSHELLRVSPKSSMCYAEYQVVNILAAALTCRNFTSGILKATQALANILYMISTS